MSGTELSSSNTKQQSNSKTEGRTFESILQFKVNTF